MASLNYNLLDLDVDKLFEDYTIDEVMQIGKLLDTEIERKRVELRGMVGDRYKDVLTASDAIKSMKSISEEIVVNINSITEKCETLVTDTNIGYKPSSIVINQETIDERTIVMQIRLAMVVNNQIWMALEEEDFSKAAQIYLLAQHISTGLQLSSKDVIERLPILRRMKSDLNGLRHRILNRTKEKLQVVQLSTEETSSNLNALMLLEQFSGSIDILNIFVDLRKSALIKVINEPHPSVRVQIVAMLKCLINTVHLLHECFLSYKNSESGLIWQQLESIESESAPTTLSKIVLPITPLIVYIPELVTQFRPKRVSLKYTPTLDNIHTVIENWLKNTVKSVREGLKDSLDLVTNIKALHVIREEALKIELPSNWDNMCNNSSFPKNFHIWFYFFQELITDQVKKLITTSTSENFSNLQSNINESVQNMLKNNHTEADLRWYTWKEESDDVSRVENNHISLSMKTKGYSPNVVKLCSSLDQKYCGLFKDLSLYLYGKDNTESKPFTSKENKCDRKFVDKTEVENYLKTECISISKKIIKYLEEYVGNSSKEEFIIKSLLCARLLNAISELCPNYKKCCCGDWEQLCISFNRQSIKFWGNWMSNSVNKIDVISKESDISILDVLQLLPKWETREIQEQTDEKTFKSQIKVPSQPSLFLEIVIIKLSEELSAIIPHTLPKQIHLQYIETSMSKILEHYEKLSKQELNQIQALQFLFDMKFITTLAIPRENIQLISKSQSICDELRSKVDPFDLDVFYVYLQNNVKTCVLQSQVIFGCLLPNSGHLANLGLLEKNKDLEKEPSILAVSIPSTTSWFPLLPVTTPVQKHHQITTSQQMDAKSNPSESDAMKTNHPATTVRSGAAAFFGAMTNDWFS